MAYASEVVRGVMAQPRRRMPRLGFIAVVIALLLTPLAAHLLGVQGGRAVNENRHLADPPAMPAAARDVLKLPAQIDAYLNDHFGLRRGLVSLSNRLRYHVFHEVTSPQLTVGKNGFLFFTSHSATDPLSLVNFLCGQGITPPWIEQTAGTIGAAVRRMTAQHPASTLMIVPTKTVLYPEYLPDWLQGQCGKGLPPVPGIVAALGRDPAVAAHVRYPYDQMMALKPAFDVFPKENFHWEGEGARRVAEALAEQTFGLGKLADLPSRPGRAPSDIQHFVPGVRLDIHTRIPDYAAAGVSACDGAACFPELGEAAGKLGDVSRYRRNGGAGPRLLLVSDSFGHAIAGYFAQYFGEVWHLSTNNIKLLSDDERRRVKRAAFGAYAPDRVLYLYHDFSMGYFTIYPTMLLDADAAR